MIRKGNISKRCMVCIMSAMMMMSSVTGTMISSIGAYAQEYANIGEMTAVDGKYNLAEGDTLAVNEGTINENKGTISENKGIVENNENGTVVSNAGTVYWGNVTKNESSGTVIAVKVTDNYGTAREDSRVTNNYGNADTSSVTDNWASGTVSGLSLVKNNHGGRIVGNDVSVTNDLDADPGPNPPAVKSDDSSSPDTTNPNDPPQTPASTYDKTVNGHALGIEAKKITDAIDSYAILGTKGKGEKIIDFKDNTALTSDMVEALLFYKLLDDVSIQSIVCVFNDNGTIYVLTINRELIFRTTESWVSGKIVPPIEFDDMIGQLREEKSFGPAYLVDVMNETGFGSFVSISIEDPDFLTKMRTGTNGVSQPDANATVNPENAIAYSAANTAVNPAIAATAPASDWSPATVSYVPENGGYTVTLTNKEPNMTFLRQTLEKFAKDNDRFEIDTPHGKVAISLTELLSFNDKAVNFRVVETDTAIEIYVNGEQFRAIPLSELN